MHKELSRHIYRSSLIGLASTSILLTLAAGNAMADTNNSQPTTPLTTLIRRNEPLVTREVVRTITYVNPLTKEKHSIRQVATYQFDRNGKVVKSTNPIWSAYFAPYFDGYAPLWVEIGAKATSPDSADEKEEITYRKVAGSGEVLAVHIFFTGVDGKPLLDLTRTIQNPNEKPVTDFALPAPPDGWEYADLEHLPKTIKVAPGASGRYTFMIRPVKALDHHEEHRQENKVLWRKIILHLPTGDQTIMQQATATREVTVKDGKTTNGEWQISPFAELRLPPMTGYQTSIDRIAARQLTADQLDQAPLTVEVNYQKTGGPATKDETTQTASQPAVDTGSQTDQPMVSDGGTQTNTPAGSGDSQTDQSVTNDQGMQTDETTAKDAGTQTDPNNPPSKGTGAQTDQTTGTDEGTQTNQPTNTDAGSQTTDPLTTDTGIGEDTVDITDHDTQTDSPATTDTGSGDNVADSQDQSSQTDQSTNTSEGTQTDQSASTDAGSQTVDHPTIDTEVGNDTVDNIDHGTQTDKLTAIDEETQTNQPISIDAGSQTADYPSVDTGVGNDMVDDNDQGTQTDQSTGINEGTQTDQPATTDAASQTTDHGTQTDGSTTAKTRADNDAVNPINHDTQTAIEQGTKEHVGQDEGTRPDQLTTDLQPVTDQIAPAPQQIALSGKDSSNQPAAVDPIAFHNELDRLQRPLRELAADPQQKTAATLPQTGNQAAGTKAAVVVALTTLTAAGAAMFTLRKRR